MRALIVALAMCLAACQTFPADVLENVLAHPRILAVQADPSVAFFDDEVTFSALVVDGQGQVITPELSWRICDPQAFDRGLLGCREDEALFLDDNTVTPIEVFAAFPDAPPFCNTIVCTGAYAVCGEAVPQVVVRVIASAEYEGEELFASKNIGGTSQDPADVFQEPVPVISNVVTAIDVSSKLVSIDMEISNVSECEATQEVANPPAFLPWVSIFADSGVDFVPPELSWAEGGGIEIEPGSIQYTDVPPKTIHIVVRTPMGTVTWQTVSVL